MTVLNRAPSAMASAAVGSRALALHGRQRLTGRLLLIPLVALLTVTGVSGLTPQALAHSAAGGGSTGFGASMGSSPSGGGNITSGAIMGPRRGTAGRTRSVLSMRRFPFRHEGAKGREDFNRAHDFRRFHRRHRAFADAFFPWGFGWPYVQSDFAGGPSVDSGDQVDGNDLPFWPQFDRYEPPTVEKSPSGVTIIRGPGSHHGIGFAPP